MKKLLIFTVIALLLCSLVACRSEEEEAKGAQWKELGTKAMEQYLQDKYGFDVELKNIEVENQFTLGGGGVPSASPYVPLVVAQFEVNGTTYEVCADVTEENNVVCYDDYQRNEIRSMLLDYLSDIIGEQDANVEIYVTESFPLNYQMEDRNYHKYGDAPSCLMNRKCETIEDIFSLDGIENNKNYDYSDIIIQVYYIDDTPFVITDEIANNLKRTYSTKIIRYEHFDVTCYDERVFKSGGKKEVHSKYDELYYLPAIEQYYYSGYTTYSKYGSDIIAYTSDDMREVDGVSFYGAVPQTTTSALQDYALSPVFTLDEKCTAYIPTSILTKECNFAILMMDEDGKYYVTKDYNGLSFVYSDIEGDYLVAELNSSFAGKYSYWCIADYDEVKDLASA